MTPHNLLKAPLTEQDLAAMFSDCPAFPLLPVQGDPYWERVMQKPLTRHWWPVLKELATKEAAEPMPELPRELYADFTKTGNRLRHEVLVFERRRRLSRAAICALLEPEKKIWWESTLSKWRAVFDEKSWALPAHVADPSGYDPDTLDLFSCETMSFMCDMLSLFSAKVPGEFRAQIRNRVREMQEIYLAKADTLMWTNTTSNWNAVCHQGVLGSALAVESDPELMARLTATTVKYLKKFLGGFSADGGCTEGPSYWNYGFGNFCHLNEQIEKRTHDCLSLIQGDALIEELAHYGRRMALENEQVINFADCHRRMLPSATLLAYLGERLKQPANRDQAESDFHKLVKAPVTINGFRSGFLQILQHLMAAPETDRTTSSSPESFYYPELGVWISRGTDARELRWTLAAKGGHNEEHHNHNDVGALLLQVNTTVFLAEIGTPEYVKEFFKIGTRYNFLAARTYGHSLPIINGVEQHVGIDYSGKITESSFGIERDVTTIDFGGSYPKEAGVKSARRHLTVEKKSLAVTIRDEFSMEKAESLESALITFVKPKREGETIILENDGVRLLLEPGTGTRLRTSPPQVPKTLEAEHPDPAIEKHFYSNHQGQRTEVYRIVFEPVALGAECETEIVVRTEVVR